MSEIRKTGRRPAFVILHADGMLRLTLEEMQQLHAQMGEVLKENQPEPGSLKVMEQTNG